MELSVIIVNFNTVKLLADCLESIYRFTLDLAYEIIVVDNGSLDGSQEMVKERFPEVVLLENQRNLGFAGAVNPGIRIAQGKFVLLLNSDTLLVDNSLRSMVDFLKEQPEVGGMNPKILNADGSLQIPGNPLVNLEKWRQNSTHQLSWVSGAAAIFPRQLLLDLDLLDEKFFFYNEDLDLSKRIRARGLKLAYYPGATIIHLGGGSTGQINEQALWYGYQGGFYYCRKHYGGGALKVYKAAALMDLGLKIACLGILAPFLKSAKTRDKLTAYQRIFKDAMGGLL